MNFFTQKSEKQFEKEFRSKMTPYPVLDTPRLRLRRVFREDIGDIQEAAGDLWVTRFEPWGPNSEEETAKLVENILNQLKNGICTEWAIERKEDAKVLGLIHLNHVDTFQRRAEIGYWIQRRAWGNGYTSEALRALIGFSFDSLCLNELTAVCHPDNAASARVLVKNGFRLSRILPKYITLKSKTFDCPEYRLTRWEHSEQTEKPIVSSPANSTKIAFP